MWHAARVKRLVSALAERRLVGRTFGEWRLECVVGQGRFGTCFLACNVGDHNRHAILKLISQKGEVQHAAQRNVQDDIRYAAQHETQHVVQHEVQHAVQHDTHDQDDLWTETKALSLCHHVAIPEWLGIVRERMPRGANEPYSGGLLFVAQTYMPGESLQHRLFRNHESFDLTTIASIARQLADVLTYIHKRGVMHNDVRPANILLDDKGHLSLVDFGLATFVHSQTADAQLTEATALDRAGFADAILYLLYACPEVPKSPKAKANTPWYDDLVLPDSLRDLLLDLFSDHPTSDYFMIEQAVDLLKKSTA